MKTGEKKILTGHTAPKANKLDSFSPEKRAYFAAYSNMAQQNAYLTLLHISKKLGIDETDSYESNLYEMKIFKEVLDNNKAKAEQVRKAEKMLDKHFPFLKYFFDKELSYQKKNDTAFVTSRYYSTLLKRMLGLLNSLRNYYTHYSPEEKSLQEIRDLERKNKKEIKLSAYLRNCFEGGRRKVKDRFKLSEEDMEFLTGNLHWEKCVRDGKKEQQERNDFYYKLDTADGELSHVGRLYFICLFIDKKYATMFVDQVGLFDSECLEKEKKIIREIFSVARIRLPKERLESQSERTALALDMLNELQKCPSELFETLSPEDRNRFRVKTSVAPVPGYLLPADPEESEVLMMRYRDRFPRLALRYLDECEIFDKIRFQVALGKYRYAFYDKQCIDSESPDRVRSLEKDLNGFGRLQEIEEERKKQWGPLIRPIDQVQKDEADSDPYITDHHASYLISGNRIGLWFDNEKRWLMPSLPENPLAHDLRAQQKQGLKIAEGTAPLCWLSVYELPGLLFHQLLSEDKKETERIIIDCVSHYHRLFNDMKEGRLLPFDTKEEYETTLEKNYSLAPADIPEKIQDYLTGKEVDMQARFNKLAEEKLVRMIETTEYRLEKFREESNQLGEKENKIGKKGYVDLRPGHLAVYLAKDFLAFQQVDAKNKNKVTGLNYQILQSHLALYDKHVPFQELCKVFEHAHLINEKKANPILQVIIDSKKKPADLFQLYERYLEIKICCLKYLLADKKFKNYFFLYADRKKWEERSQDYYKELAGRYLKETFREGDHYKPIELPRQLFEKPIRQLLNKKYGDNPKMKEVLELERCNVTHLINEYFRIVCEDGNQEFYYPTDKVYRRTYRLFNLIRNKTDRNRLVEVYVNPEEKNTPTIKVEDAISSYTEAVVRAYETARRRIENDKKLPADLKGRKLNNLQQKKDEDLEKAPYRMAKALSEFKKSERAIRRYKVQDMLMFLMAKDILQANSGKDTHVTMNGIKKFKLSNIKPVGNGETESGENILTLKVPFSLDLLLADGSRITIRQEELKLKNYGDFYRFVFDRRIKGLIPYVKKARVVDRAVLEEELGNYDLHRPEIFKIVHSFEQAILNKHPELLDPGSEVYYYTDCFDKKKPVRLNFNAMIRLQTSNEDDLDKLIEIRNSFGHNRYAEGVLSDACKLPKVAKSVKEEFAKLVAKNKKL